MRDVVPGELVVGYRRGVDRRRRADVRRRAGVRLKRTPAVPGVELVRLGPGRSPAAAGRSLERRSEVAYVEPNRFVEAATMPNDPRFGSLWGLHNDGRPGRRDADVDAPGAWRITRGSPRVTVAVVDTGIASGHPDLARNIWTNPGETGLGAERNGLDDDDNGYVDDSRGWDWTDDGNDPRDVWWHGSHVAGIVGARGNNGRGVAGLSWHGRLMALKVLGDRGRGFTVDVAAGFAYAGRMGSRSQRELDLRPPLAGRGRRGPQSSSNSVRRCRRQRVGRHGCRQHRCSEMAVRDHRAEPDLHRRLRPVGPARPLLQLRAQVGRPRRAGATRGQHGSRPQRPPCLHVGAGNVDVASPHVTGTWRCCGRGTPRPRWARSGRHCSPASIAGLRWWAGPSRADG